MVAKNLLEANLKLGSFSTSIKVKLTIEDEEFAFLEREDTEIEAEITIKYKANDSVKGNNLFLVYCKDRKKYILCSGEDVEKELAIMKKGSGTRLRIEVCCPYSSELEEKLNNTYRVNSWIKLSDEDFGELAMEMVKAREVKTETPMKKKIIVDEKEAKDKEEEKVKEENLSKTADNKEAENKEKTEKEENLFKTEDSKEENIVGPNAETVFKDENLTQNDNIGFLLYNPQRTKKWMGGRRFYAAFVDNNVIFTETEESSQKEIIYGTINMFYFSDLLKDDGFTYIAGDKAEEMLLTLNPYYIEKSSDSIIKTPEDFYSSLPKTSNLAIRIENYKKKQEENKTKLLATKLLFKNYEIEIYEKSNPTDRAIIYNNFIQTYHDDTWTYHYNIINTKYNLRWLIKCSEDPTYNITGRYDNIKPILVRLKRMLYEDTPIRTEFKRQFKLGSCFGKEVGYVDVNRCLGE